METVPEGAAVGEPGQEGGLRAPCLAPDPSATGDASGPDKSLPLLGPRLLARGVGVLTTATATGNAPH